MGGCCCCSSKETALSTGPTHYYCPRASEEQVTLSQHEAASNRAAGLLVDTNLNTSTPDTYRSPPAPLPYDVASGHPQTPPATQEFYRHKVDAAAQTNSDSVQDADGGNSREVSKFEDLKGLNYKTNLNLEVDTTKEAEAELSKCVEPVVSATLEEEDVCPICLEEYNAENPKIITKCDHHYHLACILEWMERSDTCPVCDQEMIFSPPIN